jgi:hypothetical protein
VVEECPRALVEIPLILDVELAACSNNIPAQTDMYLAEARIRA